MGGLNALIKRLAEAAGLSDEDAQSVIETAVDFVKEKRPDKAEKIDEALSNEKTAQRAGDLIAKLVDKTKPDQT
jgi:nucleoid DNA-binding protein